MTVLDRVGPESKILGILILELLTERPDWMAALQMAMTRPSGVTERRAEQDPWAPPPTTRPRRISDDLGWLRVAIDEPAAHGLQELVGTAAVAVWDAGEQGSEPSEHLSRLDRRGVLDAAGFLFREVADSSEAP